MCKRLVKYQSGSVGVLSILRNVVEILLGVTIRQHEQWSTKTKGFFHCDIRGSYWSGMYATTKNIIVDY